MSAEAAGRQEDKSVERYPLHPASFKAGGRGHQVGSQNVEKVLDGYSPCFREEPGQDASTGWASIIVGWPNLPQGTMSKLQDGDKPQH